MAKRPGNPTLDPDHLAPVTQTVADVDGRGRVRLPLRLSSAIKWIAADADEVTCLMVLDEPGKIVLRSWKENADAILERRRELIEELNGNIEIAEELRLLEDRYHRLIIPKDLRPTLGIQALMHLGISSVNNSPIYISMLFDQIHIYSPEFRNSTLARAGIVFPDLP